MQCLLALVTLAAPRFVIVLVWLFSDWLGRAYETRFWPLLGFLFMPVTTLAYAWAINERGGVQGLGLVAVVLGVLIDLGLLRSSRKGDARKRGR